MRNEPYPVITIRGDAYERGRQHGTLAGERVQKSVAIYQKAFSDTANLSWDQVIDRATVFTRAIEALDLEILAEMQGIGDGSGYSLEEIVAVNCRTEILFGARQREHAEAHECTTIAVSPNASASGSTIIGKNWDWRSECQESVIILQVEQTVLPNFVMVVEAGMVGRDGFNEAGISICGNLLRSTIDGTKPGVPVPFIRRRALNSDRFDNALRAVFDAERAASTNYLLAHESGTIINFEASPDHVYPVYPERGLLTHSNHFTALEALVQGIGLVSGVDTLYRHQRARDLLEPKIGAITVDDVKATLSDHIGRAQSICRHPDPDVPESRRSMSIASIVIDLGAREMHVASGPPCCNEYQVVGLPGDTRHEGAAHAEHAHLATH